MGFSIRHYLRNFEFQILKNGDGYFIKNVERQPLFPPAFISFRFMKNKKNPGILFLENPGIKFIYFYTLETLVTLHLYFSKFFVKFKLAFYICFCLFHKLFSVFGSFSKKCSEPVFAVSIISVAHFRFFAFKL